MWEYLSTNSHPTKSFQALTRIKQVQYEGRKPIGKDGKDINKLKCQICGGHKYEHILMLIIHIEILHPGHVQKYCISGDSVNIIEASNSSSSGIGYGFIQPIKNSTGGITTLQQPFYLKSKMETRVSEILNAIAGKLERALHKK